MDEVWADIPQFPRYKISNFGRVWNNATQRIMSPSFTWQGHLKISLIDDRQKRHSVTVHNLVAQAFVEPPNHYCTEVILLDGDLSNVAYYNLAWRSPRFRWLYARQMRTQQPIPYQNLRVCNINTGAEYDNIIQAGITEGLLFHDIWESTWNKEKRVFPYGHTYRIIQRV